MSKPHPPKYKTTNWKEYTRALRTRGSLTVWLDTQMQWQAPGSGKPGRPAIYSDAAVQCCLTMKVLFGLALRQTQGVVQQSQWQCWTELRSDLMGNRFLRMYCTSCTPQVAASKPVYEQFFALSSRAVDSYLLDAGAFMRRRAGRSPLVASAGQDAHRVR
ncbi:MAG: hypothetical protein RLY71_2093 [Pseudomonadota bacterium]|jgi:hypothetical protein